MSMGPWSRLLLLCWVLRSGREAAFLGFCGPGGAGRSEGTVKVDFGQVLGVVLGGHQ